MDRNQYTNLAKAWQYVEDHALAHQSSTLAGAREAAEAAGSHQTSAAQASMLSLLVRLTGAKSVIAVGTGSVVETMALVQGLDGEGMLTAVDSSAQGVTLIRKAFDGVQDSVDTKLRAVNAQAGVFLPRLNGADYDLIVVAGDAGNYAATFAQASRLLRGHGLIIFTDVLALGHERKAGGVLDPADRSDKAMAMRELLDTLEADEGFSTTLTSIGTGLLIAVKH